MTPKSNKKGFYWVKLDGDPTILYFCTAGTNHWGQSYGPYWVIDDDTLAEPEPRVVPLHDDPLEPPSDSGDA